MNSLAFENRTDAEATTGRSVWRWVAGAIGVVVLLMVVAGAVMVYAMQPPGDLDLSTTVLSESGLYRATIVPAIDPVPVNQLHTWTLVVETSGGQPVTSARIVIDGDMPQHRHGMPTTPQVTQELGDGEYLVEGMRFQMGGWWVVEFEITVDGQTDVARFNLVL
jgi:hypothetical protein